MEMGFIIRACSMTAWCSGSKVRCQRQSCMYCVRGCSVASATRPHVENCTAGCRWVWYGATPTGRCFCILTSRCKPRSMLSSTASPNSARHDAYGCGSARKACAFPLHSNSLVDLRWVAPTYTKIHQVLTNPFYAGVYVYGRTQQTCYLDAGGRIRKRIRQRDREQWPVFIRDHHAGYIDWNTFEANQKRLAQNIRPRPHQSGGAVREGAA